MTGRIKAAIMMVIVSLTAFTVGNTLYTIHYVKESERQICGVLNISQQDRPKPPVNPDIEPETDFGKDLLRYNEQSEAFNAEALREIQRLSARYDCPKEKR